MVAFSRVGSPELLTSPTTEGVRCTKADALDRDGGGRGWLARRVQLRWCGERECTYEVRLERGEAGGTLRINLSNTDFEFTDPAMNYDAAGWQMLYAVNSTLLNYPDKPAPEGRGSCRRWQRASRASRSDGKTYTFTIRKGLKFSDGSPLTASAFKRAIERAADPKQASPAIAFIARRRRRRRAQRGQGRLGHGVTAKGLTLTIKLSAANPTVPGGAVDAVLPAPSKPSMRDRPPRASTCSRRPVRTGSSAATSAVADARAEPELQGQPPGERRPDHLHGQHRPEPEPAPGPGRPGRLRRRRRPADGPRRPRDAVRRQEGRRRPVLRQLVPRHELRRPEHLPGSVQPGQRPQGCELRHRPPRPWCASSGKFYGKRTDQILPPGLAGLPRSRRSIRSRAPIPAQGEAAGRLRRATRSRLIPHHQRAPGPPRRRWSSTTSSRWA